MKDPTKTFNVVRFKNSILYGAPTNFHCSDNLYDELQNIANETAGHIQRQQAAVKSHLITMVRTGRLALSTGRLRIDRSYHNTPKRVVLLDNQPMISDDAYSRTTSEITWKHLLSWLDISAPDDLTLDQVMHAVTNVNVILNQFTGDGQLPLSAEDQQAFEQLRSHCSRILSKNLNR